jgi:hypothetical protein
MIWYQGWGVLTADTTAYGSVVVAFGLTLITTFLL